MNVGHRLAQLLVEYGIKYVFGVPGGQTLPLYHGILRSEGQIQHVLMRDERSAGFAADAYARFTGRTGVCDATVGPGATNLISPVAEAYCSSIPILAIISDIPRSWEHRRVRGNASQAVRQLELFYPISKWQCSVSDASALDDIVDTAFRVANTGKPGPVVISIPEDVFAAPFPKEAGSEQARDSVFPRHRSGPDPEAIRAARRLILEAEKPLLLVGGGALISGAFEEIRALAERLTCPVATTITGKGILEETHPLAVGVAGAMASPETNRILEEADLVIFMGNKTGQLGTLRWDLPRPGVPTIHIDVDSEEIGRNFPDSLPIVADARLSAAALLESLAEGSPKTGWNPETFSQRLRDWYEQAVDKPQGEGEPMKPQVVMDVVNRFVTEQDLAVCDASLACGWASVYYRMVKAGRLFVAPRGIAGLGWGAPAAIGAALAAHKGQRILTFVGDGGFAYSVQELEVMARLKLPVVIVVFNNDALAWIKHVEKSRFEGDGFISTDFQHVDFATVAQGFGARGYTVRSAAELSSALEKETDPKGPAVIDALTDQWETPLLRFSSSGVAK